MFSKKEEKSGRGFAGMSSEKRKEAAKKGGKKSHKGLAALDPGKRKEIAKKGGKARHKEEKPQKKEKNMFQKLWPF